MPRPRFATAENRPRAAPRVRSAARPCQAGRNMMLFPLIHRNSPMDINTLSPAIFHAAVLFPCRMPRSGVRFPYRRGSSTRRGTAKAPWGRGGRNRGPQGLIDRPSRARPMPGMSAPFRRQGQRRGRRDDAGRAGASPRFGAKGPSGLAAAMSGDGHGTVAPPSGDGAAAGLCEARGKAGQDAPRGGRFRKGVRGRGQTRDARTASEHLAPLPFSGAPDGSEAGKQTGSVANGRRTPPSVDATASNTCKLAI